MNQLLQEAFERAARLPMRSRTSLPASCWPSWNPNRNGPTCLPVPNRRTCWRVWPTRRCQTTTPGKHGPRTRKICRRAFIHAAELLGCIPAHSRACAAAGQGRLPFFASNPNHPSLDFKRVSRRRPVLLGTHKRQLSSSRRTGPRRHIMVLD